MWFPLRLRLCLTFSVLVCSNANLLTNSASSLQPSCHDHERSALLQFKSSFRTDCSVSYDPQGFHTPIAKTKSWIDGPNADCCSWQGIECSTETGHVIGLNLTGSCLFGTFPPNSALFSLSHLKKLLLDANDFNDSHIPSKIGQLHKLQVLNLFDSSFRGRIPSEISKLWELSTITLGDGMFGGISKMKLEDGSLSRETIFITTSCKIMMINLSQNRLAGRLPRSLANCRMLEVLDIGQNCVNDTFPSWLRSMPNLQALVLRHNNFHGSITDQNLELCFHSLRIIDMSTNFLTGNLPLGYLKNWQNMMVSKEDKSYSSHTKIINVLAEGKYLYDETFEYTITITNKGVQRLYPKILDVFRLVDFSSNKFSGEIPNIVGELKGLQSLNLSNNNLEGKIPSSFGKMTDLESLDLSRNMLSGSIPLELSHLTSLEVFDISYNCLNVPIPQGSQFNTFDNSSYEGNPGLCGSPLSKECRKADVPESPTSSDESKEDSEWWIDWITRSSGCRIHCWICHWETHKHHEWFMDTFQRQPKRRVKRAARQRR